MDELVAIAESLLNKPTFIRKRDGFYKFGMLEEISYDGVFIRFFDGGGVKVLFSEMAEIRPFEPRGKT